MTLPDMTPHAAMYCRQCGYRLVGLSENRCPECGVAFDPEALLVEHREKRKVSPSARWVAWNMLRHRTGFWRLRQVRYRQGPPLRQDLGVLLLAAALCAVVLATIEIPYGGHFDPVDIPRCIAVIPGILMVLASATACCAGRG